MPVTAFRLFMWTQVENVSNDMLRPTCPRTFWLNLSIAAGKVWYRKKDAKKRNPLFFFSLCINPCYRHARYEDGLYWERVRRWDFEWNRVADIGGRQGSHLSEKKTSHKYLGKIKRCTWQEKEESSSILCLILTSVKLYTVVFPSKVAFCSCSFSAFNSMILCPECFISSSVFRNCWFSLCIRRTSIELTKKYRKIPKISPGAYIFERPFLRGLSTDGKFAFQNQLG